MTLRRIENAIVRMEADLRESCYTYTPYPKNYLTVARFRKLMREVKK